MKFICDRTALLKEIGIAQDIIPSGSSSAITVLSNIYLEARAGRLLIKATDINVYYETQVPVSVVEEGSTMVFGGKLFVFLQSLPDGEIEFTQDDMAFTIKPSFKKLKFSLRTMSSDQFPEFHAFDNLSFFAFPIRDFKEMIQQTLFAVSDDPTRYHMNGVYFEKTDGKLVMVATDGRRLALIEKDAGDAPDFPGAIIPTKILSIITKYGGDEGQVSISITDKHFFVEFGSYKFYSSLFEGQFPNYRKVIPENHTRSFSVNRAELMQAMRRVHPLVEKQTERLYFKVTGSSLTVFVQDSELGSAEEEIDVQFDGDETHFALKYGNLEEPLKVMGTETVTVHFTDLNHAFTVKPEPAADYFHVMMPMQTDV
jgi:DNA polymerase-3 subunit beta